MRISASMMHATSLNELNRVFSRLATIQSQIATGRRVRKASDDPIATHQIMRVSSQLRAAEQYTRNLAEASEFATASETALASLVEVADRVQTIAIQVADDSYGPEAKAALAQELNGLLEEAVSLANTKYAGKRLFGGYQTREEPFQSAVDEAGQSTGVTVTGQGTAGRLQRLVGENVLLTINLTASDLFGGQMEFFDDIVALRDAAAAGDGDKAAALLAPLEEGLDRLNLSQALVGGLQSRIDGIKGWQESLKVELEASRSSYEDLDVATAAMEYQKEQAILQAALSTTADLMQMSLVNYMK